MSFRVLPLIVLAGVSVPGYIVTMLFHPVCLKLEKENREGDQSP